MAHSIYLQRSTSASGPWTTLEYLQDGKGGTLIADSYIDQPGPGTWFYRLTVAADASTTNFGRSTLTATVMNK